MMGGGSDEVTARCPPVAHWSFVGGRDTLNSRPRWSSLGMVPLLSGLGQLRRTAQPVDSVTWPRLLRASILGTTSPDSRAPGSSQMGGTTRSTPSGGSLSSVHFGAQRENEQPYIEFCRFLFWREQGVVCSPQATRRCDVLAFLVESLAAKLWAK